MNPRLSFFAPFIVLITPMLAQQIEQPATPPPVVTGISRPIVQTYPPLPAPGRVGGAAPEILD